MPQPSTPVVVANDIMPLHPGSIRPGSANSQAAYRISALDFTKGLLVLIMVLYHWINYFYGAHDNRYLRFLTPSFIFITGFLISNIYIPKYGLSDPRLPKRLLQRGLKLFGVFFVLDLMRNLLIRGGLESQASKASLTGIYLIGSGVGGGQTKAVAFFILVPISYLLIFSAALVILARFYRYTFHAACLVALSCVALLAYQGIESPNLELLAVGLMGVIVGYLPIEKINSAVRHPYLLAAGYLVYLCAVTVWNVRYPIQIFGVFLSVMIIYLMGMKKGKPGFARGSVLLLGKYSLVGYIAQIAILQVLRVGLSPIDSEIAVLSLSLIFAVVLTISAVKVLDIARGKSKIIDTAYKAVFA